MPVWLSTNGASRSDQYIYVYQLKTFYSKRRPEIRGVSGLLCFFLNFIELYNFPPARHFLQREHRVIVEARAACRTLAFAAGHIYSSSEHRIERVCSGRRRGGAKSSQQIRGNASVLYIPGLCLLHKLLLGQRVLLIQRQVKVGGHVVLGFDISVVVIDHPGSAAELLSSRAEDGIKRPDTASTCGK